MSEHPMSERDLTTLIRDLRNHPDVTAVIVWVDEDVPDHLDPETTDWEAVVDRSIELGHEVIEWTSSEKPREDGA